MVQQAAKGRREREKGLDDGENQVWVAWVMGVGNMGNVCEK